MTPEKRLEASLDAALLATTDAIAAVRFAIGLSIRLRTYGDPIYSEEYLITTQAMLYEARDVLDQALAASPEE